MNLLCDANEYKFIRDHVDVVYDNGDTQIEKKQSRRIIKENIAKLVENGIKATSSPNYLDDWHFITQH